MSEPDTPPRKEHHHEPRPHPAATTLAGAVLAGGPPALTPPRRRTRDRRISPAGYAVCTIHANAPLSLRALIKGDGISLHRERRRPATQVVVQKFVAGRWVAVGVPVQGVRYDVIKVWGTAYTSFAHGTYRTKSTGKVPSWRRGVASGQRGQRAPHRLTSDSTPQHPLPPPRVT